MCETMNVVGYGQSFETKACNPFYPPHMLLAPSYFCPRIFLMAKLC